MKKSLSLLGAALGLALLITGCETSGSSAARIQEKSAVYATLKPWQKKNIDKGVIAMSMTEDMVYMSIGNPSTKQPTDDGVLWIYKNYYPSVDAEKLKRTYNTESHFQPSRLESNGSGGTQARGAGRSGPSAATTGGPQGSMDLADMPSYTLWVTFKDGLVSKLKLDPN